MAMLRTSAVAAGSLKLVAQSPLIAAVSCCLIISVVFKVCLRDSFLKSDSVSQFEGAQALPGIQGASGHEYPTWRAVQQVP